MQLNILGPHSSQEFFDGQLSFYYPAYQSPAPRMGILLAASGRFAAQVYAADLAPFAQGLTTEKPVDIAISTPDISQRRFPFDSPEFDIRMALAPPIRPERVIVRNLSESFMPVCKSLAVHWTNQGELRLQIKFRRDPFVQTTVLVMCSAALIFACLLALIRETEDLAVATASYFFSIWSVRGIVAPADLAYSSVLDLWLMGASLLALFIVSWRLSRHVVGEAA